MDLHIKNTYESIIVFAKDANKVTFNTYKEKVDTSELENDGISFYEKDYPLHNGTSEFHINNRPNLAYSIYYSPETGDAKTIDEKITKDGKFEIGGPTKEGEILIKDGYVRILPKYNTTYRNQRVWRWGQEKFLNEYKTELLFCLEENGYYIYQKKRYENGIAETKYKNYINIDGGIAKKELFQILDLKVFENPKPLSLIQHLLNIGTGKDDLVMDFFAGSGTTAHAVLKLNNEDGGKRRFVLVQLPEATSVQSEARKNGYKFITEITAERIRRVIKGYGENPQPIDVGFKVFTLSESNYPENNFVLDADKSQEENQKAFIDYLNKAKQSQLFDKENDTSLVYENIVKEGLSLNSKVEIVTIGKNKLYKVTDGEQQLLICLESKLASETVKELTDKSHKGKLFICLESSLDDTTAANLSLNLDLKTI
jgi:adenine-specific DNA-methyltransferase